MNYYYYHPNRQPYRDASMAKQMKYLHVKNIQIDLLLCCGDFQVIRKIIFYFKAIRNTYDMHTMACPVKYLQMGSFYKYYCGLKVAPCLTIIIGGNHESSSYLRELLLRYFGGWVAPNIYFLGYSGCVVIKKGSTSLRVGGISGIFSVPSFQNSYMERYPFDEKGKYSVYHQKQIDIFKWLLYTPNKVDIFLSHDWPQGIVDHGNKKELLQRKKHFAKDIMNKTLGSPPLKIILEKLQPYNITHNRQGNRKYWFSAHLHVKFAAQVNHQSSNTKFLALDKCQAGRDYLHVLHFTQDGHMQEGLRDFESPEPVHLFHDEEWMATLKITYKLLTIWEKMPRFMLWNPALKQYQLSNPTKFAEYETEKAIEVQKWQPIGIPQSNFQMTAEAYNPFLYEQERSEEHLEAPDTIPINPQTQQVLEVLGEGGEELNHFVFLDPVQRQSQYQKDESQKLQDQSQHLFVVQDYAHDNSASPEQQIKTESIDEKIKTEDLPFI